MIKSELRLNASIVACRNKTVYIKPYVYLHVSVTICQCVQCHAPIATDVETETREAFPSHCSQASVQCPSLQWLPTFSDCVIAPPRHRTASQSRTTMRITHLHAVACHEWQARARCNSGLGKLSCQTDLRLHAPASAIRHGAACPCFCCVWRAASA